MTQPLAGDIEAGLDRDGWGAKQAKGLRSPGGAAQLSEEPFRSQTSSTLSSCQGTVASDSTAPGPSWVGFGEGDYAYDFGPIFGVLQHIVWPNC